MIESKGKKSRSRELHIYGQKGAAAERERYAASRRRRTVTGVLLLVLGMLLLTACGSSDGKAQVKCLDIVKACSEAASEGSLNEWYSYGEDAYDDSFDSLYGVRFDMVDDGAVLQTAGGGVADEVSVLHLKKSEDVSIAKKKLEDRVTERRNQFNGYKPEEVYKLDNARIVVQGNYVALLICDDADNVEAALRGAISGESGDEA